MRATETVLFELDDTLHDEKAAYRATALRVADYVAVRFGLDGREIAESYLQVVYGFHDRQLSDEDMHGRDQSLQARFWGRCMAEFGIRDRELAGWCGYAFEQWHGTNLAPIAGVPEMLAFLREKGVRLGLLSNGASSTDRKKIDDLGLTNAFDEVFLADEIGMLQPDPRLFVHACERLHTSVEHSVMVGDLYERDIIGAKEAGLFTIWVNRGNGMLDANAAHADAMVTSIVDTIRVLPPIYTS
jgi:putative hydrolase of the HAD superfamily